jgi:NAD(P)-dependent dehydrogenase (short-subunit alcohol dehydrogenase family)
MIDFSLKGKVALVTGASRGIGEAAAIALAGAGADVALASRKAHDLEKVAVEIRKTAAWSTKSRRDLGGLISW